MVFFSAYRNKVFIHLAILFFVFEMLFFSSSKFIVLFDEACRNIQREGRGRQDDHHRHVLFLPLL